METSKLVLQYLQTILSWPVITGILTLYFVRAFKVELGLFLNRLIKGQAFGVSIEASNPSEQRKELAEESVQPSNAVKQLAQESQLVPHADSLSDRAKFVVSEIQKDPEATVLEITRIYNAYHFERSYNLIFGTQVALLEHLASVGDKGAAYINLAHYYWQYLEKAGSSPTEYQYADYIGFLRDLSYIEVVGNGSDLSLKITPYGMDFLSYIKTQYARSYKYRAF